MSGSQEAQHSVDVTVTLDELSRFEREAFLDLVKELELPGFRKGHVPEDVARKHVAQERIFREAIERAVAKKGQEALEELGKEFVGEPKIEVRKAAPGNPLEFRITVEVLPEVPLEDWEKIRIPFAPREVSEEDVEKTLEELRRSRAKYRAVLRPAALGDLVEVDYTVRVDGKPVEGASQERFPVTLGEDTFLPGFEGAVIGMSVGEEKIVTLPFPLNWPKRDVAGREAEFAITVRNIQERILPELNDDFAKSLGRFVDLAELKESIREGLVEERRESERRRVRTEAVDKIAEKLADASVPEVLVAQELGRMREELKASIEQHGMSFEDYLDQIGKREEEFAEDWRQGAIRRVKAALVLRAIAKKKQIAVPEEEVEARLHEEFQRFKGMAQAEQQVDSDALRAYTENVLRNEKTLELIEQVVTGRLQQ